MAYAPRPLLRQLRRYASPCLGAPLFRPSLSDTRLKPKAAAAALHHQAAAAGHHVNDGAAAMSVSSVDLRAARRGTRPPKGDDAAMKKLKEGNSVNGGGHN